MNKQYHISAPSPIFTFRKVERKEERKSGRDRQTEIERERDKDEYRYDT